MVDLHLPDDLIVALASLLERRGLVDVAKEQQKPGGAVGGASKAEAEEYLGRLGTLACVRPLSMVVDPRTQHKRSNALLSAFMHQGHLALVDLPCAFGGTSLGMLMALAELRKKGRRPPLDLKVDVLGLDISNEAMQMFREFMDLCIPTLSSQNIELAVTLRQVDVKDEAALAVHLNDWLRPREAVVDNVLVMTTAFSGYGSSEERRTILDNAAKLVRNRLVSDTAEQARAYIWAEPIMSSAEMILKRLSKYLPFVKPRGCSEYTFQHPFQCVERKCRLQSDVALLRVPHEIFERLVGD